MPWLMASALALLSRLQKYVCAADGSVTTLSCKGPYAANGMSLARPEASLSVRSPALASDLMTAAPFGCSWFSSSVAETALPLDATMAPTAALRVAAILVRA